MKKIFLFLFSLFITTMVFAYDCLYGGIYYNLDYINKTAIVTHAGHKKYNGDYSQTKIVIPQKIQLHITLFRLVILRFINVKTLHQ